MKNEKWKTALGASLILHVLLLATAIRAGSYQAIAKPKPIEVELGLQADQALQPDVSRTTAPPRPGKPSAAAPPAVSVPAKQAAAAALPVPPAPAGENDKKTEPKADPVSVATTAPASREPAASPSHEGGATGQQASALAADGSQGASAARSAALTTAGSASGTAARPGTNVAGALPYVIKGPPPAYPREARAKGWTGKVRVRVLISEQGTVKDAVIALGSGHAGLDEAARQALQRWLFSPAYKEGRAVAAWVVVPVLFKLE